MHPNFSLTIQFQPDREAGLQTIDHIVGNVELGAMEHWVTFFADTMGFQLLVQFDDTAISTEYSALMSKVVQDGSGKIKLPINEPGSRQEKIANSRILGIPSGGWNSTHCLLNPQHY